MNDKKGRHREDAQHLWLQPHFIIRLGKPLESFVRFSFESRPLSV
ncbi:MAG: hypothetical protein ACPGUZ_00965 [Holosporaceae bacterium]